MSSFGGLIGQRAGAAAARVGQQASPATGKAMVLYLQFNNPTNELTTEWKGIFDQTGRDPDHPTVRTTNFTRFIDTHDPKASQREVVRSIRQTLDELLAQKPAGRLTGVVVSGHSIGGSMMNRRHAIAVDVRAAFEELAAADPRYAAMLGSTEKVALLGCFMGGDTQRWQRTFKTAAVAGVERFSPLADSEESCRIYQAADCAQERCASLPNVAAGRALSRPEDIRKVRRTADSVLVGVDRSRQPVVSLPLSPAARVIEKQRQYTIAHAAYQRQAARIATLVRTEGAGASMAQLNAAYAAARNAANAARDLAEARQDAVPYEKSTASYRTTTSNYYREHDRITLQASALFSMRMARQRTE